MTYTDLRDFLDRYTNSRGVIQGDPATIAAEAVAAGLVLSDSEYDWQFEETSSNDDPTGHRITL